MLDDVEDQREYFGLDLGRLMCVVKEAKKYVTVKTCEETWSPSMA